MVPAQNSLMTKKIFCAIIIAGCFLACKKEETTNYTTEQVINGVNIYPAPPSKWFGGDRPYFTRAGFVGDVMPYFEKDSFHVFYLHDARDGNSGFHPWSKFTTNDLLHYTYDGVMIPYGGSSDLDLALGTGSIVKSGDTYYAFYSGFNPAFNGSGGKFRDNILLAKSNDLSLWQKDPAFIIKPETTNGYNYWEFRDPYVFYNNEKKEYWMLVCGRKNDQAAVMLYTSTDVASGKWQLKDPLYTTSEYNVPETPQLFKWGNYWYLVFSENSAENSTHYRIATSSSGPWTKPANDKFDGQYMYASKVATDGTNYYLFGWCPTKSGAKDGGSRDFGGNLVVHQLTQNADGSLDVKNPATVESQYPKETGLALTLKEQSVGLEANNVYFPNREENAFIVFDRLAGDRMITATIGNVQAGAEFGFVFGMDKAVQNTSYYQLNFKQADNLLSGISINNNTPKTEGVVNLKLEAGKEYPVKIMINGSVCVIYVNNQVALTTRIYSANHMMWGLFGNKGVSFKNIKVYSPQ